MLTRHVAVFDGNRNLYVFGPGDEVPSWARELITNPKVLGSEARVTPQHESPKVEATPPPKAGKGSGEDKWRAYAAQVGVDVSRAEGRDDIISILDGAGVPVE